VAVGWLSETPGARPLEDKAVLSRCSFRPARLHEPIRIPIADMRVEKSAVRFSREESTTERHGHAFISIGLAAHEGNKERRVIRLIPDTQNGGRGGGNHVLSTRISAMSFQPLDAGAARVVLKSAALARRAWP
jgi:hypothetical protein